MSPDALSSSELFGVFMVLISALSYLNSRFWKLSPTIAMLIGGLVIAGAVALSDSLGWPAGGRIRELVQSIPFGTLVFDWLLSFLLFSSAVQIDVKLLFRKRLAVISMTLITTLITMLLLGAGFYGLLHWAGLPITWPLALLFGAIIAPTDPVAVLPILQAAHVPKTTETLIAGESLFNDGVGVVAFTVLVAAALPAAGEVAQNVTALSTTILFLREMLGGLLAGALLGFVAILLIRNVPRDENTRLTISLAMVVGGNALAQWLGISAPVTVAASGLMLSALLQLWRRRAKQSGWLGNLSGDERRQLEDSQTRLSGFWQFIDYLLNAALFTVMAFEVLSLKLNTMLLLLAPVVIGLNLLARALGVWIPVTLLKRREHFPPYTRRVMIWAGLRGGVTLALAFNLPDNPLRGTFLVMSYAVVVFSMLVQGLTLPGLARKLNTAARIADEPGAGPHLT
ncbi:sodium:proton antiporter [Deinococcus rubellus]|uniref:Sodium:proton antiporter n=1 Tax=Deinococcus rubellus TaxID=1889240 RepID=A0ABY5YJ72_9DEIO|nr:sodium:proton antiporter [Deinococcus rubellus]UWX65174.1 sodium:proton antiporter [Deinococcus rubellus]